jgi:RNA polymerase sigma-70 factor (ECF subfamily)
MTTIWPQAAPAASLDIASAADLPMDNGAFAGFYERTARPLWAYLAKCSGDPALADDLMQESFVRFLCADAPTDGDVEARCYLFRIASNLLRDHWRRPVSSSIEDMPEMAFAAPDTTTSKEAQARLAPALASLRPRERQMLWLAHAEGYSHREIAGIMGLGSTSIRLLLFRARKKLAALLEKGGRA